jgi:hypothetical protein
MRCCWTTQARAFAVPESLDRSSDDANGRFGSEIRLRVHADPLSASETLSGIQATRDPWN